MNNERIRNLEGKEESSKRSEAQLTFMAAMANEACSMASFTRGSVALVGAWPLVGGRAAGT